MDVRQIFGANVRRTGRRGRAIELDLRYVDVAVRRWQKATGEKALSLPSGFTFDECEQLAIDLA